MTKSLFFQSRAGFNDYTESSPELVQAAKELYPDPTNGIPCSQVYPSEANAASLVSQALALAAKTRYITLQPTLQQTAQLLVQQAKVAGQL